MNNVFGYTRVSTLKQGEGVSLIEQKEAIKLYAQKNNLTIIRWFEEKVTAAKKGRPLFTEMMYLLRKKKATGVIMHKIDRSTRNLRDWADIGELIDTGIQIHFAHESIDMNARGGRLSADIQAVIASDYIRNLREEAKKGLYGRLKQGLYPFYAPVGYINTGKGKVKTIDPLKGPLVKRLFEYYSTGNYGYHEILKRANQWGLTNSKGGALSLNGLTSILNNTFYIGLMEIKGKVYKGIHPPLISTATFKKVKSVLMSKTQNRKSEHRYTYRRLVTCHHCGYSLVGSKHKGHVYYRCQTKNCPTKTLREDRIENYILKSFDSFKLSRNENLLLETYLGSIQSNWGTTSNELLKTINLQINRTDAQLNRLTDALIDGAIDKEVFDEKKKWITVEKQQFLEQKNKIENGDREILQKTQKFLELSKNLKKSYQLLNSEEKREFLKIVTSNLATRGKNLEITMVSPFRVLTMNDFFSLSALKRDTPQILPSRNVTQDDKGPTFVFSEVNTSSIPPGSLSEEQLKLFLECLMEYVNDIDFNSLNLFDLL